jgi:hypothetical protein
MSGPWPFRLLRWSYCAFIAWASAQVFFHNGGAHESHARILAGVEIAAIVAFLFPATEIAACIVLLLVYALASAITAMQGEVPVRFLYYAATATYIVIASRANRTEISTTA